MDASRLTRLRREQASKYVATNKLGRSASETTTELKYRNSGRFIQATSTFGLVEPCDIKTIAMFGDPTNTQGKRSTVNETMLRTLAYRLQFKYKIPVLQTANVLETAYTIKHLNEIFQQDPAYFKETPEEDLAAAKQATATTGNFTARRKDNVKPAVAMLMGLHGVSLVKAEAILTAVPSIQELCSKSAKEIADVPAGKGRIGPKLGTDIHGALH